MLSLSQTTGYAIRALSCLGRGEDSSCFMQEIAEASGVPRPYLAKILKKLNDKGIVESKRGYTGGIWLERDPSEISLLEIAEVIDGPDAMRCCLLGDESCSDERHCPTHEFWKRERAKIVAELEGTSLADVIRFNQRRGVFQVTKKQPS